MPPVPVIPNAVKVAFKWGATGQSAFTTFGITTSTSDLAAVAASIGSHVSSAMWGCVSSSATISEMHLFRYDGATPTFVTGVTGSQWLGAAADTDFGVALAALVSFRTATRGQWARGRIYLPFTAESANTAGSLTPGFIGNLQTAWDAFRTGMQAGGTPLAVISLADHPELNPPHTPAARLIISSIVEAKLATQRRRQTRLRRT